MKTVKYVISGLCLVGKAIVLVIAVVITLPLTLIVPQLGIHLGEVLANVGRELSKLGDEGLRGSKDNK